MKKKVIVIGGGIAGLSAGVYALRCGFGVTVLESHGIAGGNCTSWRRGDYLFEGGMHWLTGSDPKQPVNKLWRTIGALDDSVAIHCPEPYIEYIYGGEAIKLYRNVELTEKHWIELSPEDEAEIKALCGNIRKVNGLAMPVSDIRGVKVTRRQRPSLSLLVDGLSAMGLLGKLSRVKRGEYIARFKHEGIRKLLRSVTNDTAGVVPLVFSMGIIGSGDGGFPEGGSLPFVDRIVERFKALGGELRLNTRAERVVTVNGRAVGVKADGKVMASHAVIITADTMTAGGLFKERLNSRWLDEMRETTEPTMTTFISLGLDADLSAYNKAMTFELKKPIKLANQTYESLNVNNYAGDGHYSPAGKSAVTVMLEGDTYEYWKKARADGGYKEAKQRIAGEVIAALADAFPETAGLIEVCDVATPLTYERYCGNWKGSWMTELTPKTKLLNSYPAKIRGLEGVYFAGQRMSPPGGLPVALQSGRTAVQYLCRDTNTVFVSEE